METPFPALPLEGAATGVQNRDCGVNREFVPGAAPCALTSLCAAQTHYTLWPARFSQLILLQSSCQCLKDQGSSSSPCLHPVSFSPKMMDTLSTASPCRKRGGCVRCKTLTTHAMIYIPKTWPIWAKLPHYMEKVCMYSQLHSDFVA